MRQFVTYLLLTVLGLVFLTGCQAQKGFYLFLFRIISAAMTPGTQPMRVSRNTMSIDPQPWSITASGGKIMARMTWRQDMVVFCFAKVQK